MTTNTRTATQIVTQYRDGLITQAEATLALDKLSIRGGFDGTSYVGYDYSIQAWVTL
jgi:hypothetical protein